MFEIKEKSSPEQTILRPKKWMHILKQTGYKIRKLWNFEFPTEFSGNSRYENANKWVMSNVIASQLSIHFVHKNDSLNFIYIESTKTWAWI